MRTSDPVSGATGECSRGSTALLPPPCSNVSRSSSTAMLTARTSTSALRASIASPCWNDLDEVSLARLSADGFDPCAVVETSAGNFQAWLRHATVFSKLLGTFAAPTLASRYGADPSAADWRRFGRLPAFTHQRQSMHFQWEVTSFGLHCAVLSFWSDDSRLRLAAPRADCKLSYGLDS